MLPLLYQVAPGIFGRFRYPEKFYFLVHVAATVLAAQGVDNLLKGDAAGRRGAVVTGTVLLLVAVALCAIQTFWPDGFLRLVKALKGESWPLWVYAGHAIDLGSRARRAVWILGAFLALLELRRRSLLGTNVIAWAMLGLVATDLAAIHRHLNLTIPWSELQDTSPLVDVRELQETHQRLFHYQSLGEGKGIEQWDNPVREADNFREVALRSWPTLFLDVGMVYGISTAVGFDGIVPRAIQTLRRVLSIIPPDRATNLLGLCSVRYLIGPTPLTASSLERIPVGNSSPLYVYRVRDAMPLAYVVHRLKVAEADLDAFNALIAPSFQPTETAVVSSSPLDWKDKSIGGLPDSTVAIATFDDMHVAIDVTTREGGFLVLNQSYFPGWEAWIDDVPVPIVRTNVLVRGVPIGMGSHRVDFRYRPESFRWGLRISVLGVVLFIVLVIASSWSARSGRA